MGIRGKTLQIHRLSKTERQILALLYPERGFWRPRTREDCSSFDRPCPYVGCRYHLYLDVGESGNIRVNYPDLEIWDLEHSCSLDLARRGGLTPDDVGEIMGLTRERVRQIENVAMSRLRANPESEELIDQLRNRLANDASDGELSLIADIDSE